MWRYLAVCKHNLPIHAKAIGFKDLWFQVLHHTFHNFYCFFSCLWWAHFGFCHFTTYISFSFFSPQTWLNLIADRLSLLCCAECLSVSIQLFGLTLTLLCSVLQGSLWMSLWVESVPVVLSCTRSSVVCGVSWDYMISLLKLPTTISCNTSKLIYANHSKQTADALEIFPRLNYLVHTQSFKPPQLPRLKSHLWCHI